MRFLSIQVALAVVLGSLFIAEAAKAPARSRAGRTTSQRPRFWGRSDGSMAALAPKLFIVNLYDSEGTTWLTKKSLGLYANNVTVPGLSPLFPDAHCTEAGDVCQVTTGEGQINAASSIMALAFSPLFNLTKTYFMIAGVAGINPTCGTSGSVAFSRYAVEVSLQYEIDPRDIPSNYSTGYIPQGTEAPNEYPAYIYGTEVFELNENLRDLAISLASKANLTDTSPAKTYRAQFPSTALASNPPSVFAGDTASSDNWFSGATLGDAFANFTVLVTNGTGRYCMTAQEDNGCLEALLRADFAGYVDFSRVMLTRIASDFDRPPPGVSVAQNLIYEDFGGLNLAYDNMYAAGIEIVKDIRVNWAETYEKGVKAYNYVGDIFNTLNSSIKPDFGIPADYGNGSLSNG